MVPSSECFSSPCTSHKRFSQTRSSTAQDINCDGSKVGRGQKPDSVTITFGTGEISGNCVEDTVCLGSVCTEHTAFIASDEETVNPFGSFSFDGVLGLARSVLSQSPQFSLMQQMSVEHALRSSIFSVFLSDQEDASEITFGGFKNEHVASELFWVDVVKSSGYWEVNIDDITISNRMTGTCRDCKVAVDTGTSDLAGPSAVIAELRHRLDVKADCSNYEKLPLLGFKLADQILNLRPEDYVSNYDMHCEVSLMSLDVPPPLGPLFVFGVPFLQRFYTVYDHANDKVGFAIAK